MDSRTTDGRADLREKLRAEALRSTFVFGTTVCGFADLKPDFHTAMALWIERDFRPDPDNPGKVLHCRNKLGMAPRGHLKALSIDTPVATPRGFVPIGELHNGDEVYGRDGRVYNVAAESEVTWREDVYTLTFSTGERIVADAGHLWITDTRKDRENRWPRSNEPAPSAKTTEEIAATVLLRREHNHRVVIADVLRGVESELLVPPYTLGAWLGDGTSSHAAITSADEQIVAEIAGEGVEIRKAPYAEYLYLLNGGPRSPTYWSQATSLSARLRAIGVFNNKHIPHKYLWAAKAQRLALLQGLMDTDGSISKSGQCFFTNMNRRLVEEIRVLVASLGMKPSTIYEWDAVLNGRSCGRCFTISFYTYPDRPVFRLDRKLKRIQPRRAVSLQTYRQIVAAERAEPCFVKCIRVTSPDSLFLVSEGMIPTHNSSLWTVADKLRRATANPNLRILISNETEDNITKWMNTMQAVVLSPVYRWLFPELVPDFDAKRKPRWNQTQLELRRTENWPQATIEGIPVGGASTSNHYEIIDNDDVVGKRARMEPSTMQKAIDHGKLCWSLLVNPAANLIHDVGTRWSPEDYLNWRLRTTRNLDIFRLPFWKPGLEDKEALWHERFPADVIDQIRRDLGEEFFALQYENDPLAHGATDFDVAKLRKYRWAYRMQPNGVQRKYVILERPEHEGGDRWFPVDEMNRTQIMDPGLSPESRDARTANVVVGLLPGDRGLPFDIVILRADAVKANPNAAEERGYEVYCEFDPLVWGVETFGAQELFFYEIARRWPTVRIRKLPKDTSRPKEARIRAMYPFVDQGRVYVHESEGHEFVREFAGFPNGRTVDLLDAFAWIPNMWVPPQPKLTEEDEMQRWREEWRSEMQAKYQRSQDGRSPITGY